MNKYIEFNKFCFISFVLLKKLKSLLSLAKYLFRREDFCASHFVYMLYFLPDVWTFELTTRLQLRIHIKLNKKSYLNTRKCYMNYNECKTMTSTTIGKLNISLSICLHNIIPSGTGVESLNSAKDTFFLFIWLPHNQLWAILDSASLTRCSPLRINYFGSKVTGSLKTWFGS